MKITNAFSGVMSDILNPEKVHPERVKLTDKEFAKKLDYSGVTFPVKIKDISKIEIQNQINISVFGYESKKLYPIRVSHQKYRDHLELLYIQKDNNSHYVYIKDFNRLMYNFTNIMILSIFVCIAYIVFLQKLF